jgi:3-oxoacyl-[acyl-carrier protein] reductase
VSGTRSLEGRIAIVTGAGRGIGRAIAGAAAREGASVCCAARNRVELDRIVDEIREMGGEAIASVCDISNPHDVDRMVAQAVAAYGGVDLLVANAGLGSDGKSVESSDIDAWKRVMEVNLFGTFLCARAVIPAMRTRGGGKIITVGSGMGHRARSGVSAYGCSKAGTWMLTRILASELEPVGIDVNELIPGPVLTDMTATDFAAQQLDAPELQRERFKTPSEVLPLFFFLATQPPKGPTAQSFGLVRREM